ncbi:hypothetical protein IQ230_01770 [Gloeocapsopsis crepidinum LEGE 06123]|uniref:Uncharacterized protein n=1 Tax=Gloeocapsopsis crepidinum LEGE 06123 TaxID=588587 RepID=A0ABR9UP21_9CHRO|nr:hypothetical protein [Gloeocapsopsis crepidinum]MBE9189113.1 hypothetical protein [Gloeocapsopsis crepidinum LEGE 06123]
MSQQMALINNSHYRAPELYELGNIDKIQGFYIVGFFYDFYNWLIWF